MTPLSPPCLSKSPSRFTSVNGDGHFHKQNGLHTHSVSQRLSDTLKVQLTKMVTLMVRVNESLRQRWAHIPVPSWLPAPWCLLSPPAWDTHLPSLGKRSSSLTPRPARPASRRTSRSLLWQWIQRRLRHPVTRLNTVEYLLNNHHPSKATSVLRSETPGHDVAVH